MHESAHHMCQHYSYNPAEDLRAHVVLGGWAAQSCLTWTWDRLYKSTDSQRRTAPNIEGHMHRLRQAL
eukprot:2023724-Amphidinium_carterae.1